MIGKVKFGGLPSQQGYSMTPEPLLIPASKAASVIGVSRSFFYQMHSDGRLGPLPIAFGAKKVWRVSDLEAWVQQGCPPRSQWLVEGAR